MKKKSSNNSVLIGGVVTVVIAAGALFAITQDWKTGRNHLVEYAQAQMGDPDLQYAQAMKAKAADKRDDEIKWLTKAADGGKVEAMLALGDIYDASKAEEDGAKAVSWYEKAAKAGNAEGMRKLGLCYLAWRGGVNHGKDGMVQLRAAAAKGDVQSYALLGDVLLHSGHEDEGIGWLEKAADAGNLDADVAIGDYFYGEHYQGLPNPHKDLARAFKHYERAAYGGNWRGRDAYAYAYFYGRGTKKDRAEAYKWALYANNAHTRDAQASLDYLTANLSPAEIAEGKKRFQQEQLDRANASYRRPLPID